MTAVNEQDREMAAGSGGMPAPFDYGPRGHSAPEATPPSDQGSSAAPPDASANPPPPSSADQSPPPASSETPPAGDDAGGGDTTPVVVGSGSEPTATAGAGNGDTGDTSGAESALQPVLGSVDGTISDLAGGTGALDGATGVVSGLAPVSGITDGTGGIINTVLDTTGLDTNGTITPVTGTVDGLLNDVTSLPGTLLSGGLINDVTGLLDSALGVDSPLGTGNLLSPVTNLVGDVGSGLGLPLLNTTGGEGGTGLLGSGLGSSGLGNDVTGLVDSTLGTDTLLNPVTSLVSDVGHGLQHVPLLSVNSGDSGGVTVGGDGSSPVDGVTGLLDSALGTDNLLSPVTNLVGDAGSSLGSDVPLAHLNGGDAGTATVGDLNGSSSGNLIDLAAGQSADGLGLGLLSPADSDNHLLDVNAVDAGTSAPQLVNADLVPGLNGDAAAPLLSDLAPVTNLAGDLDSSVPLLHLDGGDAGTATVGDLHGSSSGNLIDLGAGQSADGLGLGLLSPADSDNHLLDLNGVEVGSDGPHLVDADLVPGLNGDAAAPLLNGLDLSGLGTTSGPLLTVNGAGSDVSAGDLGGSSSGHLVDASAGSHATDGTGIDVLATPLTDGHALDVGAIDVGSGGPQLADASLLDDTGLLNDTGLLHDAALPSLDGVGLPSLGSAGDLIDTGSSLLTVNGGNNAADGGLIGGTIGTLDSSSSGHLVDADVGSSPNGGSVDVLAAPTATDHALSANAVDVGPNGPQLADLGVLTDHDAINIPALGGTSADSLVGNVLGDVSAVSAPAEAAPAPALTDTADLHGLLPAAITGDHGIVDVLGHHVI